MKILIIVNHINTISLFREELIDRLISENNDVFAALPIADITNQKLNSKCNLINIDMERHGKNPIKDIDMFFQIKRIIRNLKPDIVLTYTIKPNIYGSFACILEKTPYINNVTGIGTAMQEKTIVTKILLIMMKIAFRKSRRVFFQNKGNYEYLLSEHSISEKTPITILPGSGVNLEKFKYIPLKNNGVIRFLIVSRIRKDKGYNEFLDAAEYIKKNYENVEFHIVGMVEDENLRLRVDELSEKGIVRYHGSIDHDAVSKAISACDCLILPSYHEGMANVNLEAAATGRAVITTCIPGCKETIEESVTGFECEAKSSLSLIDAIERFIDLDFEKRKEMGINGRHKMEREFNRNIVINHYLNELNKVEENIHVSV